MSNVPEIRFKGFTDAWVQRKFSDIVNRVSAQSNVDNLPKVEFEDIVSGEGTLNKDISNKFDNRKGIAFEPNHILYGKLRPYLKNWLFADFKGVALGDFWVFEARGSVPTFNYYLIQTEQYQEVANLSTGTKMPRSDWNTVSGTKLSIPAESAEQTAVGKFFRTLDTTITLHKRKLNGLKELKMGYLQRMFPQDGESVPRLRFERFVGDWEMKMLKEVSNKVTEKNIDKEFTETLTNSAEYGIINQREFFDKDISNEKNIGGYFVVHPDDFVYNPRISNHAPVGPIRRNLLGRTGVMSPLYYIFRVAVGNLTFIEKYFESVYWHKFMKLNGDNGVRADRFNIKDSVFEEMPIPFPSLSEQKAIGEWFHNLDNQIIAQQTKLDNLKQLKSAYLQKMFV